MGKSHRTRYGTPERMQWLADCRKALWFRHDGKCALCERSFDVKFRMTIDHICPIARGGSHDLDNLRPVCDPCHNWLNTYDQCIGALLIAAQMEQV